MRCKLCPLHERHGNDQHEAEGTVAVSRGDGGVKVIDCCETCADETFDHDPGFTPYGSLGEADDE